MAEVGIEIKLDKRLQRLLDEGNDDLERKLWQALLESGHLVKGAVQEEIPTGATRLLSGSVFFEPRRGAGELTGVVGTPSAYALPVEDGARPHAIPLSRNEFGKLVPEPLVLWFRRKYGLDDDDAVEAAWGLWHNIKKHGTMRYKTKEPGAFATAFMEKDDEVQRRFDRAVFEFVEGR